jgi:hypothetical protein
MDNIITYEKAREHLLAARDQLNGRQMGGTSLCRIFWEDDKLKRNILVYYWPGNGRSGYGWGYTTMAQRRKEADDARKGRGNATQHPILTLRPDGQVVVWAQARNRYYGYSRTSPTDIARKFLESDVAWRRQAVHPKAGPQPKQNFKQVEKPEYVGKDGWPYARDGREKPRALKARERYEEQVAKYGSLEAWHEAYETYSKRRDAWEKRVEKWREGSMIDFFEGMVIDPITGIAQKRCVERFEARQRAIQREKDREQKRIEREADKRRKEWERMVKSGKAEKMIALLPKDLQGYLAAKRLVPNADGTLTLMKYVRKLGDGKYVSGYDGTTAYEPGKWTEAPDYQPTTNCGHGLHFASSKNDARAWYPNGNAIILAKIDLSQCVVVKSSGGRGSFEGAKIKARRALVIGEGDESGLSLKPKDEAKQKREAAARSRGQKKGS